uniref:Uncharacterized protein n=1 Tax=Cucumis melo TaxID=3656 RepID=A0A9I9EKH8_CUCME
MAYSRHVLLWLQDQIISQVGQKGGRLNIGEDNDNGNIECEYYVMELLNAGVVNLNIDMVHLWAIHVSLVMQGGHGDEVIWKTNSTCDRTWIVEEKWENDRLGKKYELYRVEVRRRKNGGLCDKTTMQARINCQNVSHIIE